ncbi:MAG: M48 family metallopeptidase [Syntrophales bacterium]
MSSSRRAVAYGKESIDFSLSHVDRKTLEIAVHPDQTVVVKAPLGSDDDAIRTKVAKRAGWIIKQQGFFRQFEPRTPERRYVGGETHLYLGRHYRLRISRGKRDAVKLTKGFFEIEVREDISPEKVKCLLEGWYRDRAAERFRDSFDRCWFHFEKHASAKPRMQIKSMRKRWGSLSANGMLTLNADLIRGPRGCIDYVITHELGHLRYKNHSSKFYRFLDKVMPDWEKRKHRLEVTLA